MLVITRKTGDAVVIGGDVVVKVLHSSGSVVKLGIDAPDSIRIVRAEKFAGITCGESENGHRTVSLEVPSSAC